MALDRQPHDASLGMLSGHLTGSKVPVVHRLDGGSGFGSAGGEQERSAGQGLGSQELKEPTWAGQPTGSVWRC